MVIQTINDLLNDLKSLATKYGADTKTTLVQKDYRILLIQKL